MLNIHDLPAEQQVREAELLERVLRSFDGCESPRLKELVQGVAQHLHAFVRDVRPTDGEWFAGIQFLTQVGQMCHDTRQEFILLSDVLGVSMQTVGVNNEAHGEATEATVFGPFFVTDSPAVELGGDMAFGAKGEPCWVEGSVTDVLGQPLAGARIDVWEADDDGLYDVQHEDGRRTARGHVMSDEDGNFRFWAITPTPYPIPQDGPVGAMLTAVRRSAMRPAHLHFMVEAEGCRTLVTHIFVEGGEFLGEDSVFGVKDSLIKSFEPQPLGAPTPDGRALDSSWSRVRFDIVLAPAGV